MLCLLATFCAVKRSTSENDLCSQPFCTFVIAYPRRALRFAASSPALLLLEEAVEAARDLLPRMTPLKGVECPPSVSFVFPSAVLLVPFVATGVDVLAGLMNSTSPSRRIWSSGVLSRMSTSLSRLKLEGSTLVVVGAYDDGEAGSVYEVNCEALLLAL